MYLIGNLVNNAILEIAEYGWQELFSHAELGWMKFKAKRFKWEDRLESSDGLLHE